MENITDTTHGDLSKRAYLAHMRQADKRGIKFRFNYMEWAAWWLIELRRIGGLGAQRGRKKHQYVMARKGDQGAYEPGNVYAMLPISNSCDRSPEAIERARTKSEITRLANGTPLGLHLRVRGDGHPKSKAVITPAGRFGSIALAADHYGLTRQGAGRRVRIGVWKLE